MKGVNMNPRIPYPEMENLAPEVKALVESFPMNIARMAANAPASLKGFLEFAQSILFYSAFDPRKREIADSLRMVMAILFGPDYKSETLEISKGGAVILVKRCPLPARSHGTGEGDASSFHRCMALTLTTIPLLNKEYSARFVRTMCTGDRQC